MNKIMIFFLMFGMPISISAAAHQRDMKRKMPAQQAVADRQELERIKIQIQREREERMHEQMRARARR